jgi:RNA polymerase sigma factor (sigma-70 family)
MNGGQLQNVVRRLSRLVGAGAMGGLADAELVRRWIAARDQAAFEVLLWRHGPMVLGVCRRTLRREQDAEDAFQATFLALVRSASSLRSGEAIGSWLYRVAYRVAVQMRAAAVRRRTLDAAALDSLAETGPDPAECELRAALDEEVNRLPEHYRAAFVLCYLEGRTNEEAARELGRPVGTILSRLARAREQLRCRLTRRGFALPAGFAAWALVPQPSEAAVPSALVTSSLDLATRAAAGQSIPQHLTTSAEGVLSTMSMTYAKTGAAVVLTMLLVGANLGFMAYPVGPVHDRAFGQEPKSAPRQPRADGPRALRWDLQVGRTFYSTLTTVTKQTMQVMGNEITQNQKQTFIFSWTPLERKNGNWVIKQKIEGVKMDVEIGGNTMTFDSTNPQAAAGPLTDFFKALVDAEFTITLNPKLEVIETKGRKALLDKLSKANPQMQPLLEQILSEKALKQMADPMFLFLRMELRKDPPPLAKGDTWRRQSELDMGPIGKYDTTYQYTYEGKDGMLDKIKVESKLRYKAPGENAPGGLPYKIKSADLKSKDGTGTLWFDDARGRLDHSEMTQKLDGTLGIEIGGMTTEVKLQQEIQTTIRVRDDNPAKVK